MIIKVQRTAGKFLRKRCSISYEINSHYSPLLVMDQSTNCVVMNHTSANHRYAEVVKVLNSLQSNASVLEKIKPCKSCQAPNIEHTNKYLKRCSIDLNRLKGKVIHVSGTKGKGSTCALTEAILRSHNFTTGFYSSPHLFSVTERIRINGKPIPKELFIKYFWDVYNTLDNNKDNHSDMPTYFKFLTVLAFKIFISENVDVAIIEVGIGGEYDCTNALRQSSVVGITSLGYDHMSVLGHTIEEIAWNKAGIMKEGCLAFTCNDQPPTAMQILQDRAKEKNCNLYVIERAQNADSVNGLNKFMELNCSLAAHMAHAWMYLQSGLSPYSSDPPLWDKSFTWKDKTLEGMHSCIWPGRFHVVPRGNITYYLDGAHTDESMKICTQWFSDVSPASGTKVLIFNLTGSRDAKPLMNLLAGCGFELACFCPNILDSSSTGKSPTYLHDNIKVSDNSHMTKCLKIAKTWQDVTGKNGQVFPSVTDTFSFLDSLNKNNVHVLITGSLHLVGNATYYLMPDIWN